MMTDEQFYPAVASLLRVLSEQEPDRRVAHLAEEAERRATEARRFTSPETTRGQDGRR